jgi:putative FmdB family regulatory protein
MPIYEYRCSACGHEFEVIQKFSDKPIKKCAECGGKAEKLISQSSFVLKGSGWHATDYAKKKRPACPPAGPAKSISPACATCPSSQSSNND